MKSFSKIFLSLAALIVALSAAAESYELGRQYDPVNGVASGTLVMPADGPLFVTGEGALLTLDGVEPTFLSFGGDLGAVYKWNNVAAGTHQVESIGYMLNPFKFYLPGEPTLKSVSPAEGATITTSVNNSGYVFLTFSEPVSFSSAYILVGDKKSSNIGPSNGAEISQMVNVAAAMRELYANGALDENGGQTVTLLIEGLATDWSTFGTDGTLRINYLTGPRPVSFVSASIADFKPLLSYYVPGDPEGLFTFNFSAPLADDEGFAPSMTLLAGNIEGEAFFETIPGTVSGNSVSFDLAGTNRARAFERGGALNGDLVALKIENIYDKNHKIVEGNGGSIGSVNLSLIYTLVPEQIVDFAFTPDNGGELLRFESIELWHNNISSIFSFDGFRFTYDDGSSDLVPVSSLDVDVNTADGEATYKIPVPMKARTAPVTVSMDNILSTDGYDKIIRARYNSFVITYCRPFVEGQSYEMIECDPAYNADVEPQILVRTNYASRFPEMYLSYSIDDVTTGENGKVGYMMRNDDGSYKAFGFNHDYILVDGHKYTFTVKAWENEGLAMANQGFLGSDVITFYGAGKEFEYSIVEFESIDPQPGMGPITPSNTEFTITYNGLVRIIPERSGTQLGMGAGLLPFEKITPIDDEAGYAWKWIVSVSPRALANTTGVSLVISAEDLDGKTVRGDMETFDSSDYKVFDFDVEDDSEWLVVNTDPADGAFVEKIDAIRFFYPNQAVGINWNCFQPLEIRNLNGETIYVADRDNDMQNIVDIDQETGEFDENNGYVLLSLPEPILQEGAYSVVLPAKYFQLGSQFLTTYSKPATYLLNIGTDGLHSLIPADSENLFRVFDLNGVNVMTTSNPAALNSLAPAIYIVNGHKILIRR